MNKKVKMLCDVGRHYKKGKEYVCLPRFAANLIRNGWAKDLGKTDEPTSQSQKYPENKAATPATPPAPIPKKETKPKEDKK